MNKKQIGLLSLSCLVMVLSIFSFIYIFNNSHNSNAAVTGDGIFEYSLTANNTIEIGLTAYGKTLSNIEVPTSINGFPVTAIKTEAFAYTANIRSVKLPETITTIGNKAFWSCTNIESVNLPNSITELGNGTFYACAKLKKIVLPPLLTYTTYEMFLNCSMLEEVIFLGDIITIGNSAGGASFQNCKALKNVLLPATVTEIKGNSFYGCDNLLTVVLQSPTPPIYGADCFTRVNKIVFYTPTNSNYAAVKGWNDVYPSTLTENEYSGMAQLLLDKERKGFISMLSAYKILDEILYSEANWTRIQEIRATAISELETAEEGLEGIYNSAILLIDSVKTLEKEQKNTELNACKEEKIAALNNYKITNEQLYSAGNWQSIVTIKSLAILDISNAESIEEVNQIFGQAVSDIGDIKTILEHNKLLKTQSLTNYKSDCESLYTEADWNLIIGFKTQAISDINSAESTDDIDQIFGQAISDIDEIKTILAQYKEQIILNIDNYVTNLESEDYSNTNWQLIIQIKEQSILSILAASTESEIDQIYDDFVFAVSNVSTIEEEQASNLSAYKLLKAQAVNEYKSDCESLYSSGNWATIRNTKETAANNINDANSISEIDSIYTTAILEINQIPTLVQVFNSYKNTKKQALNDYFNGLDNADYSSENWQIIENIRTKALLDIEEAPQESEVNSIYEEAILNFDDVPKLPIINTDELDQYKSEKATALAAYKNSSEGLYDSVNWLAIQNLKAIGAASIDLAMNNNEVDSAYSLAIAEIDKVSTKAQLLDAYKEIVLAKAESYKQDSESLYKDEDWNAILLLKAQAVLDINNAESIEDADAVFDTLKTEIDEIIDLAKAVEIMIDNLNPITLDKQKEIEDAREAFDSLTELQKLKVPNYQKLVDAEIMLGALANKNNYLTLGLIGAGALVTLIIIFVFISVTRRKRNVPMPKEN